MKSSIILVLILSLCSSTDLKRAIGRKPVEWESISMSSFITDYANSNVLKELENLKKGGGSAKRGE